MNRRIKDEKLHPILVNNISLFTDKTDWVADLLLLGSIWHSLEPRDKAINATLIAGVRQSNNFILLMEWINQSKNINRYYIAKELGGNFG